MDERLLSQVSERYPALAKDLLQLLLDLLLSREHCGADLDEFLLLLAVGVRTVEHPDSAYRQDELLSGEVAVFPSLGSNFDSSPPARPTRPWLPSAKAWSAWR